MRRTGLLVVLAALIVAADAVVVRRAAPSALVAVSAVAQDAGNMAVDEQTNRVFIAQTQSQRVSVLDARSGRLLRVVDLGGNPYSPNPFNPWRFAVDAVDMDVATGHTFVVTNKSVTMLDTRSGRLLRVVTGRLFYGSIYVDDGTRSVFVGTARFAGNRALASIWELDSRSGLPRRAIAVDELPFSIVPDRRRHHLLVSGLPLSPGTMTADGSRMSVLDTTTGRVHPVVGSSMDQGQLAVDGGTDRLFVLSNGGHERGDPWAWLPSWLRRWLPFLPATPPRSQPAHATATTLDLSHL